MINPSSQFHISWHAACNFQVRSLVAECHQNLACIPVVFVHGLGVSSCYMLPTASQLATHYTVYVPDLPGFGASDKPTRALSIPALADLLAAWLEAVGISQAVFLGNSVGCQVIADLTVRYPQQVHSAILVGPTVDSVGHTMLRQLWRGFRDLLREPWSLWPILARDYWSAGTQRLLDTFRFALSDPVQDKLSQMQVPTLVVRGSRDPIAPQRWVEEFVKHLPRGRLLVIHNGTHATNYSAPDELTRITREFLENIGA